MTVDRPHYLPVSKNNIEKIEIHITDDLGKMIDFGKEKVVVKLHFRPRRIQYL